MLPQAEINAYHENGYLVVNNVLNDAEVQELRKVTDYFVDQSRAFSEHTDVFDLEPGHTAAEPRLRRLKSPVQQHEIYDQIMRHAGILDIVEDLLSPGVRTNGDKLNMKSPQFGSPVEWHQDWAFYPHTNDDLLAVGVCMDDCLVENGCMLVIPGSHKGPILDHNQDGHFCGAVTEEVKNADEAVPMEVYAGGISLHHVRTLHASALNTSPYPRRLLLFQMRALDAWPLMGFGDWEDFNSNILRGEPTNKARVTDVPVRMPLPPSLKTGSIYEQQTVLEKPIFGQAR
jgi:phytanoyl-CoA hydroxylase